LQFGKIYKVLYLPKVSAALGNNDRVKLRQLVKEMCTYAYNLGMNRVVREGEPEPGSRAFFTRKPTDFFFPLERRVRSMPIDFRDRRVNIIPPVANSTTDGLLARIDELKGKNASDNEIAQTHMPSMLADVFENGSHFKFQPHRPPETIIHYER
jgi:hypothetical protein